MEDDDFARDGDEVSIEGSESSTSGQQQQQQQQQRPIRSSPGCNENANPAPQGNVDLTGSPPPAVARNTNPQQVQLQQPRPPPVLHVDLGAAAPETQTRATAVDAECTLMNRQPPPAPAASSSPAAVAAATTTTTATCSTTTTTLRPCPSHGRTAVSSHQSFLRQQAHSPVLSPSNTGQHLPAYAGGQHQPIGNAAYASISSSSSVAAARPTFNATGAAASRQPMPQLSQPPQPMILNEERRTMGNTMNNNTSSSSNNNVPLNPLDLNPPERETEQDPFNCQVPASGWSLVERSDTAGGTAPSARSLHAGALLNGTFYIFGGYDGSQRVNTFHAFSFAEKRWSPVLPSATSGPPPSPRDRHIAAAFGNSFYVQGGFDGASRVSDLWAFDFSTMNWREVVALQGRNPSPRHSHAAVVHGHSLIIYGGYDGSYKSDLHEFDFTSSRWSAIPAAGRRPRARYRATCVVHKNSLILYGGHDGTRHLNDAHVFDLETRVWSSLITEGTPPVPRDSHVSVVHGNSMYVFGGSCGNALNDLFELQIPPNPNAPARWRSVNTSRADQPRHRFCHVAIVYKDSMFVHGGYDGSDRLDDFVRFDFAVYDLSFEVPPSTIISDFRSMVNDSTLSDVTFIVEGREDAPIYGHKLMLIRCSYFQSLFLGQMRESRLSTICIEQVRHSIFLSVLEYLYTDQVRIPFNAAMELFEAADLFCIPRLKTMCEKRMLQSITVENAAGIFHAADMHSATALRQKAKKYILSHFEEVSKSSSFEEMGRRNIELVFELLHSR